jgi:hypothetical protein
VYYVSLRNSTSVLAVLVLLASCSGLSSKSHRPLVFALNLSAAPVSLALVKGTDMLVDVPLLASLDSSPLRSAPEEDAVVLRHGQGGSPAETDWTDPSGTPYSLRLQAGRIYALVVDRTGQASMYTLPETYSDLPKLTVVNVLATTLSQVQVAPDWGKNVKVYSQDVAPIVPSEFYSLEAKTLGLYWQTPDQVSSGAHVTALDPSGQPLRAMFHNGHYYLFLAGDGSLRDLTPSAD